MRDSLQGYNSPSGFALDIPLIRGHAYPSTSNTEVQESVPLM